MTYEEFKSKYNIRLNEQQEKAVQAIDGPILLLAVPGSGKTTVLVNRLGYLIIAKGVRCENILTMTYTVSATKDMRNRFASIFGDELSEGLEFRTINGVCDKIIKLYSKMYDRTPFELETDEGRLSKIITQIYKQLNGEGKFLTEGERKDVKSAISYAKNMMLSDDELKNIQIGDFDFPELYKAYCSVLKENRLMDYDDQLVIAYGILRKYPRILETYQNKYKYICVDEAQDTSKIQHKIINLLSRNAKSIFMVGDEDQSIYGFRAAYPQALMNFEYDYKNATVLLMETNYRSTKNIVSIANSFISKNENRHPKSMHTDNEQGKSIDIVKVNDVVAQYQNVIKSLSQSNGKTAVLFRNNETAVALICMLDAIGYNGYSFKGADASFFTDRFVTDVLNILRFANNPYDTLLFEEICYKTIFKIKKNVVASLCKEASDNDLDIFEAIEESPYITQSHKKFFRAKKNDFLKLAHMKVSDAINEILYTFDYFKYLSHRRDINAQRVVNSKLCTLQVIGKYDRDFISFEDRLEHLQNIISTGSKNKNSQIILSTIHSSKGLEYDNVYIVDAVDDVLPSVVKDNKMSDSDKEIYLEERRLFYVAMTRAKKYLCMYEIDTRCSSFVDEVKEMLTPKEKKTEIAHNPNMFYRGNKVHHKKFGNGTVVNVDKDLITVKFNFGAYGQKIISKDYLTKL